VLVLVLVLVRPPLCLLVLALLRLLSHWGVCFRMTRISAWIGVH
jgi:hypothetical protein